MKKKLLALLFVGMLSVSMMACGSSTDSSDGGTQTGVSSDSSEQTDVGEALDGQAEDDPNVPTEYKSALRSAKSYSDLMHMSKQGIYDQLTSEYGDQFPDDAAQYAVDNLQVDWKDNALKCAENYSDTMYMSKQGIYDQLISEFGEKFTEEEAQYAIDNMEADWKANALKTAENYQTTMAMSKQAIYDQLISEYGEQFTAEEAQYAVDNLQ
ncbi:MAG: Ltp family lipoprotein [Lachnospiraceae bacterium]